MSVLLSDKEGCSLSNFYHATQLVEIYRRQYYEGPRALRCPGIVPGIAQVRDRLASLREQRRRECAAVASALFVSLGRGGTVKISFFKAFFLYIFPLSLRLE